MIYDHVEWDAWIVLRSFLDGWPGGVGIERRLEREQADSQGGEVAVEVVVLGAGAVFAHACVADPVVAALAPGPVPAGELGEAFGAASFAGVAGEVERYGGLFGGLVGAGAADDREAAGSGQSGLQGFDGVDRYGALVESAVGGVGFLGMGKKGVVRASFAAALWACRFSSLSWRK